MDSDAFGDAYGAGLEGALCTRVRGRGRHDVHTVAPGRQLPREIAELQLDAPEPGKEPVGEEDDVHERPPARAAGYFLPAEGFLVGAAEGVVFLPLFFVAFFGRETPNECLKRFPFSVRLSPLPTL
jgi:hypothetical protein